LMIQFRSTISSDRAEKASGDESRNTKRRARRLGSTRARSTDQG
jgi:hypothetical protein